jgi:DNA adenine methylase
MINHIVPLLSVPHHHYCEPFGGAASILLNKTPSPLETYNDLDSRVVNLFRVLREKPDELYDALSLTPYSREEFLSCRTEDPEGITEVEKARRFFVKCQMAFSGQPQTVGWAFLKRGVSRTKAFVKRIEGLQPIIDRVRMWQVENRDYSIVIKNCDTPDTLFYCDPPYTHRSRSEQKQAYDHDVIDHDRFLQQITQIQGKAVITHYPDETYFDHLGSWRSQLVVRDKSSTPRVLVGTSTQTEVIWWNYDESTGERIA